MAETGRLEQLKMLLGVTDDAKDAQLTFELELVEGQILAYINHDTLPEALERTLTAIAAAHWRSAGYGSEQAATGPVASVKRGDVTTSFAVASGADAGAGTFGLGGGDGFFGWRTVLNAFRKLRW